jgi:hypothetical protein
MRSIPTSSDKALEDDFNRRMNAGEEVCHAYRNGTAIGQGCP